MKAKLVCITGANGFIGSRLFDFLKNRGYDVVCCDINDDSMLLPTQFFKLIETKTPSCIFHLGAVSSTTETNTEHISENNILFSCKILEYCIEKDIPLVYASSASVYGMGAEGFSETVGLKPMNYYAISKAAFDMMVLQKIQDNPHSRVFGLRYFNVYGSDEGHKGNMSSPIYKFLQQATDTGAIKVFAGSEKFFRDFIHVDDVVKITYEISKIKKSGIYNVGTGEAKSFTEVADIISRYTSSTIRKIPFPPRLEGKYQHYTCSDNSKIDAVISYGKRLTLERGIKKVLYETKNSIHKRLF
jgi:ADP-L-glycero-D-manno-heptose 6-epimerase